MQIKGGLNCCYSGTFRKSIATFEVLEGLHWTAGKDLLPLLPNFAGAKRCLNKRFLLFLPIRFQT